jgi:hypothetical protein
VQNPFCKISTRPREELSPNGSECTNYSSEQQRRFRHKARNGTRGTAEKPHQQ